MVIGHEPKRKNGTLIREATSLPTTVHSTVYEFFDGLNR